MVKLTVSNLRNIKSTIDLNRQKQKQIQGGGINQADFDWYMANKDNAAILWGNVAPKEFRIEILVDNSGNDSNSANIS